MIGVSGCFGSDCQPEVIDNAAEVSAAVDDIMDGAACPQCDVDDGNQLAASLLLMHYAGMDRRVRLLTYAVVAMAVYILVKEIY